MDDGAKGKHGQGKIIFPGTVNAQAQQVGGEEYEGQWSNDKMQGEGCYKFTSGNVYKGHWENGTMTGYGHMVYSDGSTYEGDWKENLMHGNGVYVDQDKINWTGIFVEGQFDSKIQKKLQSEKILKDKMANFESASSIFFEQFADAFGKSDKKTFKDNLNKFFGIADTCNDFVSVTVLPKFEDRAPEKWNETLKGMCEHESFSVKALS